MATVNGVLIVVIVIIVLAVVGFIAAISTNMRKDTSLRSYEQSRPNLNEDPKYGPLRRRMKAGGELNQKMRWDAEIQAVNDHHAKRDKWWWKLLSGDDKSTIEAQRVREVNQTVKRLKMPAGRAKMGSIHPTTGENHKAGIGRQGHGRRADKPIVITTARAKRKSRRNKPEEKK